MTHQTRPTPLRRLGLAAAAGFAALLTLVLTAGGAPAASPRPLARAASTPLSLRADSARVTQPQGLSPAQIRAAYALPVTGARHQTVAIVSAYDAPDLQSDLAAYDKRFGLPACTYANGCVRKLNEAGNASPLPGSDLTGGNWVTESSLGRRSGPRHLPVLPDPRRRG